MRKRGQRVETAVQVQEASVEDQDKLVEALPRFLQVEPVGQCNLRCTMCPVQFRGAGSPGGPPAFMSFDAYCRLIEEFDGLGELHLQGLGEPLMHPRFFDMVRHASDRGIVVSTNTNMTVLSEKRAALCVASGLRRIHVSIDAASAPVYEYIRIGARLEKVLRNVRRLVAARLAAGSSTPELHIVAVAMKCNLAAMPALVVMAHELGAQRLSVQHLCHDYGESMLPERYRSMRDFVADQTLIDEDPERVSAVFDEARAVALGLGIELRLPNVAAPAATAGSAGRCDWPWRGAYVSYDGEAMPCCMVSTPDRISLGNMVREGAVRVWNGTAYDAFRRQLRSGLPHEVCRGCSLYHGTF